MSFFLSDGRTFELSDPIQLAHTISPLIATFQGKVSEVTISRYYINILPGVIYTFCEQFMSRETNAYG